MKPLVDMSLSELGGENLSDDPGRAHAAREEWSRRSESPDQVEERRRARARLMLDPAYRRAAIQDRRPSPARRPPRVVRRAARRAISRRARPAARAPAPSPAPPPCSGSSAREAQ